MVFRPKPVAYVFFMGIVIWICIFKFGFFATILSLIIIPAIVGIYLNLTGRI